MFYLRLGCEVHPSQIASLNDFENGHENFIVSLERKKNCASDASEVHLKIFT